MIPYTTALYSNCLNPTSHIFRDSAVGERVRLGMLVRAHVAPLFFFQQCSPVGIAIFTGEDPQSERMNRDESNRVYWFQTRLVYLVYLLVVFITKVKL